MIQYVNVQKAIIQVSNYVFITVLKICVGKFLLGLKNDLEAKSIFDQIGQLEATATAFWYRPNTAIGTARLWRVEFHW